MCKSMISKLFGGGEEPEAKPKVTETIYEADSRVKEKPKTVEDKAMTGGVVVDDRRRGRLAGLGL